MQRDTNTSAKDFNGDGVDFIRCRPTVPPEITMADMKSE